MSGWTGLWMFRRGKEAQVTYEPESSSSSRLLQKFADSLSSCQFSFGPPTDDREMVIEEGASDLDLYFVVGRNRSPYDPQVIAPRKELAEDRSSWP